MSRFSSYSLPDNVQYNPHMLFPHTRVLSEHIDVVCRLGDVANAFERGLGNLHEIWARTLNECREKMPEAINMNAPGRT